MYTYEMYDLFFYLLLVIQIDFKDNQFHRSQYDLLKNDDVHTFK